MDRFHISELCYGRACRNGSKLSDTHVRYLDARLALVGSLVVVIRMSDDFFTEQFNADVKKGKNEMYTLDMALAASRQYNMLHEYNPELHIDMNFEVNKPEDYLSTKENVLDHMLSEWSRRLTTVMNMSGGMYNEDQVKTL